MDTFDQDNLLGLDNDNSFDDENIFIESIK